MPSTKAGRAVLEAVDRLTRTLTPGPWALGLSGGRDSAVLLWALAPRAAPGQLTALWVDHGWRSAEERAAEARTVESLAARFGVALVTFPPPLAVERTESAARRHRYQCFSSHLERTGTPWLFLAHHLDDQAETVLMRVLKGRSWQGLGAMRPIRGPYVRPFLGLGREVLAQAAADEGLVWHEDSTNASEVPLRNWVRTVLLPTAAPRFPRAREALGGLAEAWAQLAPGAEADPAWVRRGAGAEVPAALWDRWSPLRRQAELLALTQELNPGAPPLGRRFLEAAAAEGRARGVRGAGWQWVRGRGLIRWEKVVPQARKEYFLLVETEAGGPAGPWGVTWSTQGPGLLVPGIDPDRPWVFRSAAPGQRFASAGDPAWGKETRRRRLGLMDPDHRALLVQDGLIRAVADPSAGTLVWSDSSPGKLHNPGIFVTLWRRSDYERRRR